MTANPSPFLDVCGLNFLQHCVEIVIGFGYFQLLQLDSRWVEGKSDGKREFGIHE